MSQPTGAIVMGCWIVAFAAPNVAHTEEARIEEIVVTAQKRAESVQDVPITMQAFTADQLRSFRISKASDITRLAPNLNLSTQNTASRQINIRGVGTSDFFGNSSGSVGIYMDEVTMSASYLSSLGLYDLERVEILRGPQNSLFGRNTTGGAVNYISKLPEVGGENEGYVDLTYGNFNRIEIEAAGSLRLSDTVAIRLAGKSYDRDGVWDKVGDGGSHGDKDRKSVRGTLVWDASDKTTVTASYHWAEEDSDFDPVRAVGTRGSNGSPNFGVDGIPRPLFGLPTSPSPDLDFEASYNSFNAQGNNPSTDKWKDVYVTGTHLHQVDNQGLYLKISHEFDLATFTSITSWDDTEVLWTYDTGGVGNSSGTAVTTCAACIFTNGSSADGSPQVALAIDQDQKYQQISQELRLVSGSDGPLRWIAGFYYFQEDSDLMQNVRFGAGAFDLTQPNDLSGVFPPIGQFIGGFFGAFPLIGPSAGGFANRLAFQYSEMENTVWSPYAQIEYDLSEELQLTVGLRYTNDNKEMPFDQVGNISTLNDPIETAYVTDLVLSRAAMNTLTCDLDGDGNNTFLASGDPNNTPDNRGLLCNQTLDREDLEFKEWGGKVGLDWRVADNVMVYGSYSRGFRSGKHDIEFLHGPHTGWPIEDLDAEELSAFEIGLKSELAGGSLQLNLAGYFYTWDNQQTIFVSPITGPAFVNIDESELMGLEAELKWVPAPDWYISVGLGLQDTEIKKSTDARFVEEGHELPFAAPFSANVMAVKDFAVGDGVVSVQADWQYRDAAKAYARDIGDDPSTNFIDEIEELSQINARVSYRFGPDWRYEITAFGENLTEDKTCAYKWDLTGISGTTYCVANEGEAFYGVQGRMSF
jgi:iron complex outermembrane receptor protein